MTYNEIIALAKKQGFDAKNVAFATGLTSDGFNKAIKNMTIQAKHLIKLCNFLNISPNELLDFVPTSDNGINISQNGGIGNQQMNNTTSIALEKQLEEKDKQISDLHKKIDVLLEIIKK